MTRRPVQITEELQDYLLAHSAPIDDVQRELVTRTAELGEIARMQISSEQGALMTLLVRLLGATNAVEVGTFTGYSSIAIARGLAPGGKLLCCDVSEEWTSIARGAWEKAGLSDRIELRLGPAGETLRSLPQREYVDFAFVDADKPGYADYYEQLITRTRVGGIIAFDNVFQSGNIVDASSTAEGVVAMRAFNDMLVADSRVETLMLPISDGLTLARKL